MMSTLKCERRFDVILEPVDCMPHNSFLAHSLVSARQVFDASYGSGINCGDYLGWKQLTIELNETIQMPLKIQILFHCLRQGNRTDFSSFRNLRRTWSSRLPIPDRGIRIETSRLARKVHRATEIQAYNEPNQQFLVPCRLVHPRAEES
jgi:hypothetical protein